MVAHKVEHMAQTVIPRRIGMLLTPMSRDRQEMVTTRTIGGVRRAGDLLRTRTEGPAVIRSLEIRHRPVGETSPQVLIRLYIGTVSRFTGQFQSIEETMARELEFTMAPDGSVRGVSLHDGVISGIEIAESFQIFSIRSVDGGLVRLKLKDVRLFTVLDFWNGAIISDVWVWPIDQVPLDVWAVDDGAWPILLSGRANKSDAHRLAEHYVKTLPGALMVQISCSYGGQFATLCHHLGIEHEEVVLG